MAKETAPDLANHIRPITEQATNNVEAFKQSIQKLTSVELDELSRQILLESGKKNVNEEVRNAVRERLKEIKEADIEYDLDQLENRLTYVSMLINTGPENAASNQNAATENSTPLSFSAAKDWMKNTYESFLKKIETIPFIGGIAKGLSPQNIKKAFFSTLAGFYSSPATTPATATTASPGGFFSAFTGNFFRDSITNPIGLYGQIGLVKMEFDEAIQKYAKTGDSITYEDLDAATIETLARERAKNKDSISVLVKDYITAQRKAAANGPVTVKIEVANLFKKEVPSAAATKTEAAKKEEPAPVAQPTV